MHGPTDYRAYGVRRMRRTGSPRGLHWIEGEQANACAEGCNACVARAARERCPGSRVSRRTPAQKEKTMNRRASPAVLAITTALACLSPAASLLAQTSDSESSETGLSEVVVTASRREERLKDVPISVAVFSQAKIDEQGLRNIDDLTRLSPGIAFQRNGNGSSANYNDENSDICIRGICSQAGASTTGIYIDDTPIQSRHIGFGAVNVFPALFDLDRVEVLRGPQGTLFGAGAEGGAVRFITPEPTLTKASGYARAELATIRHGDTSYEAGAAFGRPIIDNVLAFRVSASFRHDGGWVDRAH